MANIKRPLAGVRFHDLRHSSITMLVEGNAPEQTPPVYCRAAFDPDVGTLQPHIRKEAKRSALAALGVPKADTGHVMTAVKIEGSALPAAQITSRKLLEAGNQNSN